MVSFFTWVWVVSLQKVKKEYLNFFLFWHVTISMTTRPKNYTLYNN